MHEKSLFRTFLFWAAIGFPCILCFGLSWIICDKNDLVISASIADINQLINVFKIPLGALALIFPLVALVSSNHKSLQTAELIKLQNSNNVFSNYYNHLQYFDSYFKTRNTDKIDLTRHVKSRHVHRFFYPEASKGDFNINNEVVEKIKCYYKEIIDIANTTLSMSNGKEDNELQEHIQEFMSKSIEFVSYLRENLPIADKGLTKFDQFSQSLREIFDLIEHSSQLDGNRILEFHHKELNKFYSTFKGTLGNIKPVKSTGV